MLLTKKQLIGLPVKTRSGQELGVVTDFELDIDQHTIVGYRVKKSKLLPDFVADELVIRPKQVVTISQDAMIVEDLAAARSAVESAAQPAG